MPLTRRQFVATGSRALSAVALSGGALRLEQAPSTLDVNALPRFVDRLFVPAVARPIGRHASPDGERDLYRLEMHETLVRVHRDLPLTRVWGIGGSSPGPTIEARTGQGLSIEWVNRLPARHLFPIDHTLHGAEAGTPDVRTVIHVHGASVPANDDGFPTKWFVPGRSATSYYPNRQESATLWYHDHAMGINRLNMVAGLFGFYVVRDPVEDALNLPHGKCEIALMLCDRILSSRGQLIYPTSGDISAPWVPEFVGDGLFVNGTLFPYLEVDSCRYRLRAVNASNSRFLNLSFANGLPFHQIGTDQGLLPAPVPLTRLELAPGERADLVVDFGGRSGSEIVLRNDLIPALQFRVSRHHAADFSSLPDALRPVRRFVETEAVTTRTLSLREMRDPVGQPMRMLLNDAHWNMPVTETPVLDTVEIWSLVNLTDDSHAIHLHLVRFQILDRRRFEPFAYQTERRLKYLGPPIPPEPGEAGWKDTVRAHAAMVTRIIVRFEGYAGRYMWHCHMAEHGDNDMMRPFDVQPARNGDRISPRTATETAS